MTPKGLPIGRSRTRDASTPSGLIPGVDPLATTRGLRLTGD
ncbi:MAG TPA: hypothetical protein VEE83_02865 [Thermoplasmata archaeon]|nr:hypothetical protein [Thermoplasmata archaeon]